MKLAKIPVNEASDTIPRLMRLGVVNRNAKISKGDGCRLVPILDDRVSEVLGMGYEMTEGEAHSRERIPPQERIRKDLEDLPRDVLDSLPDKWEYVGGIVIIRLGPEADPYKGRIGEAYAQELGMSTVCVDTASRKWRS